MRHRRNFQAKAVKPTVRRNYRLVETILTRETENKQQKIHQRLKFGLALPAEHLDVKPEV